MDFGSLVDCLCFTPADYHEQFYIPVKPKPSDSWGELLDKWLAKQLAEGDKFKPGPAILAIRKEMNFQSNWGDDAILRNWKEKCEPFIKEVETAAGRTIITSSTYNRAQTVVQQLQTNEFTKRYFIQQCKTDELLFQYPMFGLEDNLPTKALFDILLIDHQQKIIIPLDLKVTGKPVYSFEQSFLDDNYYIQAVLYTRVLQHYVSIYIPWQTYVIQPFNFIVASESQYPIIWQVPIGLSNLCWYGGYTRRGRKVVGAHQLLEDLQWHVTNGKYSYTRDIYENNGVKLMDII